MSNRKNSIWYYMSMLPLIVAILSIISLTLIFLFDIVEDRKLFLIVAFAFAEFTMVLAGIGGIIFLFDSARTPQTLRLLKINVLLFFLAAFSGLMLFLQH